MKRARPAPPKSAPAWAADSARALAGALSALSRNSGYGWQSARTALVADFVRALCQRYPVADLLRDFLPCARQYVAPGVWRALRALLRASAHLARPVGLDVVVAGPARPLALYVRGPNARAVMARESNSRAERRARRTDAVYVGETRRVMDRAFSALCDTSRDARDVRPALALLPTPALTSLQRRVETRGPAACAFGAAEEIRRAVEAPARLAEVERAEHDAHIEAERARFEFDSDARDANPRARRAYRAKVAKESAPARAAQARADAHLNRMRAHVRAMRAGARFTYSERAGGYVRAPKPTPAPLVLNPTALMVRPGEVLPAPGPARIEGLHFPVSGEHYARRYALRIAPALGCADTGVSLPLPK